VTTDPQDERFDVLTADGTLAGETATRGDVHRRGLWHPAFHLWIAWRDGEQWSVLVQRRSLTKDTMPGKVDVSVGGHFRAGEYVPGDPEAAPVLRALQRELLEELGLEADPRSFRWVGRRWSESRMPGIVDREVQELYVWLVTRLPAPLAPDAREVAAVLAVPGRELRCLLQRDVAAVDAAVLWPVAETGRSERLTRSDLVPGRRAYWLALLRLLERWMRGESTAPLLLHDAWSAEAAWRGDDAS